MIKLKDTDIYVTNYGGIAIYNASLEELFKDNSVVPFYIGLNTAGDLVVSDDKSYTNPWNAMGFGYKNEVRLAKANERRKLFDAIINSNNEEYMKFIKYFRKYI